jgi:predicted RNA binding protein YcfA (HicA-like mRNA interferase family)
MRRASSRSELERGNSQKNEDSVPSEERFAELRRLLERDGWQLVRIRGSHHTFTKPGFRHILVPVHHGKIKPFYVKQIRKILEGDQPAF